MLIQDFHEKLDEQSKELIKDGFFVFDIEDKKYLDLLRHNLLTYLRKYNSNISDLGEIHKYIKIEDLNDVRLGFYNEINRDELFSIKYLQLGYKAITNVAGTELASNKNVNFSMQLPNDESSKLPIHMDTFSGESPFQINLWVPLTDVNDTNSMFIFNPKFSKEVQNNLSNFEKGGLESLLENNKDDYVFLNVPYGKAIIFTPTCLHGNVINKTNKTRISFNCRYKNLFSPYNQKEGNEKKLGSFYKAISPKAATLIGLANKLE
tara:strand:- start:882 stop:1673 length:792 start_codon:yes stop_codon:yes gene_type:complete